MILDPLLGMERIGPDLAAEFDLQSLPPRGRQLLLTSAAALFVEARLEHLHG